MSDCSKHKKEVAGITDMKILAEMIGDLHYETLTELFQHLFFKIGADGRKDIKSGKILLGCKLIDAELNLFKVYENFEEAWRISKPFMNGESTHNAHN